MWEIERDLKQIKGTEFTISLQLAYCSGLLEAI